MDMEEAMKLKPWEPRPDYATSDLVEMELEAIEHLDKIADRTDMHGRQMYEHSSTDLDFHLHRDGRGWDMSHRGEAVGQVRAWKGGDQMHAQVRPADESWEADCDDLANRLPAPWSVDVISPGAAFATEVAPPHPGRVGHPENPSKRASMRCSRDSDELDASGWRNYSYCGAQ